VTIRVNYDNVFRQAAILQRLGEEHRQAAAALDAQRGALAAAWQDPAGALYAAAAAQLAGQMRASADELVRLAALIKDAALRFKAQEEANAKAAGGLAS
jgi:uncharacterized protein YukE